MPSGRPGSNLREQEVFIGGISAEAAAAIAAASDVSPEAGIATAAKQDTQITALGALAESAPASDTASSGLNGRLQRIAQRLTSLLTGIVLAAGENHIGEIGGNGARVSVELTRPSDVSPYIAGDVISNSTGTTTPLILSNLARVVGGTAYIVGLRISTDKKSITPRIRVHLFNAADATVAADNAPYKELYADSSKRLGYIDLPAMTTAIDTTNSNMSRTQDSQLRHFIKAAAATRDIHVVLETLDGFTPSSGQKFNLTAFADNN